MIADRDGVYDPRNANGRLVLGLQGTISELELHTIRSRLTTGLIAKAKRGELTLTLSVGLVRYPSGVVLKDSDMAVWVRLGLVFEPFLKPRSIAKVMRMLMIVVSIRHAVTGTANCIWPARRSLRFRRS